MIKTFFEFINEASSQTNIITDKDWERMLDLILTKDTSGSKVASSIKDKKKAIARFVCGIKLKNSKLDYDTRLSKYSGPKFHDPLNFSGNFDNSIANSK